MPTPAATRGRSSRPPRSRATIEYEYKRTYQACVPCRRRKAKCQPSEQVGQPCSRCAKLELDCQFDGRRPWAREEKAPPGRPDDNARHSLQTPNATPGEESTQVCSTRNGKDVFATGLSQIVASGNDALGILFQAAAQETDETLGNRGPTRQTGSNGRSAEPHISQHWPNMDVLRVWDACRFVKMGWFTAHEALTLVDLFFKNMAPLSPILSDFYAKHHNHYWLVTQEPMLCCTILMISSRYHTLPGPGGTSRGYFIHSRLWQHCQHLILRITLGQEKVSKAKTRHLSSIEALLLISEWYPRALHFPPENDGWDSDLILTTPDWRDPPSAPEDMPMSNRWKADVVEPTRRSDRMSWMLVSNALALAHELGVFGQGFPKPTDEYLVMGSEADAYMELLESRRRRLPLLLFVFVNLIAARICCPSLLPGAPDGALPSGDDRYWASFMASWVELTRMTQGITEQYFPPTKTAQLPRRWDTTSVDDWRKVLEGWSSRRTFHKGQPFDDILHIESQYLRVFINSIEMQSFVEETLSHPDTSLEARNDPTKDRPFLTEVIDGSCAILNQIVLMSTQQAVQYLPSRIFLRVISCSIFLLKALALGARATTLHESLSLLDRTIHTLQTNCPDDMHLVSRYAALLEIYVSRVRQTYGISGVSLSSDMQSHGQRDELDPGHNSAEETNTWNGDLCLPDSIFSDDWLSLPLDPLMAPFGASDETGQLDYGLDSAHLDLDFIWNLPP